MSQKSWKIWNWRCKEAEAEGADLLVATCFGLIWSYIYRMGQEFSSSAGGHMSTVLGRHTLPVSSWGHVSQRVAAPVEF